MMNISQTLETYAVRIAAIDNAPDWVAARALEIDPGRDRRLLEDLDGIMRHLKDLNKYAGISSNNVYWNGTPRPVRVIHVPAPDGAFITLANPEILELDGGEFSSVEGCASVPDGYYVVKRRAYVRISGLTPGNERVELACGDKDAADDADVVLASHAHKAWIIQHEMDHLDGITIKDKGARFDFSSLISF